MKYSISFIGIIRFVNRKMITGLDINTVRQYLYIL